MNWKLCLQLSMFGLAMGILTVFLIPSTIEPWCWLAIFIICAYIVAKRGVPMPFGHGFMTSIFNSVWITSVHVALYDQYVARHAAEAMQMQQMAAFQPRVMMAVTGPIIGVVSGLVLGLFCWVAAKIMHRGQVSPTAA